MIKSTNTSKKNISNEFIEFFLKFSKIEKLSEEQDFSLRCGLALFQSYIEYLNKPEESIKIAWNIKIKPLLLKKYPIQKSGIFNVNADVEFLMKEIDKINTPQKEISESDKTYIRSRLNDIRINTIYISSKHNMQYKNNNNNINNNYNKTYTHNINSTNKININDNNKINKNNINNKNNFKNNSITDKNPNLKTENSNKPFDIMKKELALNMKLMKKNKQQKKNLVLIIEKEFDIMNDDKRRRSIDDQKIRKITLSKQMDPYKYVHEIQNNDSELNKKQIMLILPDKKQKKVKEMSPNYVDEHETENTIKYKNKELKMVTFDLLIKNIITKDFLEKYIIHIYYFSQQCFSFIPKETLFQKIINCYSYFKKLNTPFIYLKKIIYFFDLLVVQMYDYYHSVPSKSLSTIKKFYNNLEEDLKKKLGISNKKKSVIDSKIDEKVKLMGKMLDRIKSNQNANNEKGKIKEEKNSGVNTINANKNEKEIKNKDENEILEEIKHIFVLFEHDEPAYNVLIEAKRKMGFFRLKASVFGKKMNKKSNYKKAQTQIKNEKITKRNINKYFFNILEWEPKDIGEALICISKKYLIKIEKKELYKAIFLKKSKNKTSPNVMQCINKFNMLTSFIMEDILSYDFPKDRAKIIEAWVKVAEYLKLRKDHNDCVAIYSALKHYIISGLSLTMKELKSKTKSIFKDISEYCTFEGNYKNLREDIIYCLDNNQFYIPYLGMLLRDISFFEANYEYLINGSLINIEKIEKVQMAINSFFSFKKIVDVYNEKNEFAKELNFLNNLELIKEDDLEILANKLEPKFILSDYPQKNKRLTNVDKLFYINKSKKKK